MSEIPAAADLLCRLLTVCYEDVFRSELEERAKDEGVSFEQAVAAAMAEHLRRDFHITPRGVPGVPKAGRPLSTVYADTNQLTGHTGHRVFVSYRRSDNRGFAERIFDVLRTEFGNNALFIDVHSTPVGEDYANAACRSIARCSLLMVVIGPSWTTAGGDGRNRLLDPDDPVRYELECALEQGIPILPVLTPDACLPTKNILPESLRPVERFTCTQLRYDPDFHSDVGELVV